MSKGNKEINEIVKKLAEFRKERDWNHFHTPKNLAEGVSIESAELLECFQWRDCKTKDDVDNLEEIKDEVADVFIYLLMLSEKLDIDICDSAWKKIEKNRIKYPVNKEK